MKCFSCDSLRSCLPFLFSCKEGLNEENPLEQKINTVEETTIHLDRNIAELKYSYQILQGKYVDVHTNMVRLEVQQNAQERKWEDSLKSVYQRLHELQSMVDNHHIIMIDEP